MNFPSSKYATPASILLFSMIYSIGFSQSLPIEMPKSDRHYRVNADWLKMMDDPNANYFQTIRAYELYWEKNEKPLKRDAVLSEEHLEDRTETRFIKRMFRREKETDQAILDGYKRFDFWKMEVEPYVQDDGSILTKDQQLEIWKKEKTRK